jgi:hypothetical protein
LYTYGEFPKLFLDHINGDGEDNRVANLREADNAENMRNGRLKASNTSGFTGVWQQRATGNWVAELVYNNKKHHLGVFKTKEEAIEARKAGNIKFGFHKNHGRA